MSKGKEKLLQDMVMYFFTVGDVCFDGSNGVTHNGADEGQYRTNVIIKGFHKRAYELGLTEQPTNMCYTSSNVVKYTNEDLPF